MSTSLHYDDAFRTRRDERVEQLRVPPMSIEAEQAVLGGVMLSPKAWVDVEDILTAEDFYRRDHQLIFRAISELSEKDRPYDAVTLGEWFESNGMAEQVAGGAYLIELASTTPSAANVRAYARIVRDKAKLRQFIDIGTGMVNDGFHPDGRDTAEIMGDAQVALIQLADDKSGTGPRDMREVGTEWFDDLQDRYYNPEKERGIVTPWSKLNGIIDSLEDGHLVILAARPSMGKSAAAVNLSTSCALREPPKRKRVLYIDLESTGRAIFNRAVSSLSNVPLKFFRNPKKYEEAQKKLKEQGERYEETDTFWSRIGVGVGKLKSSGLKIDDTPGLNIRQICARARREFQREPFHMLVIDHLHLIPLPGKTRETVEIGHITAALKKLAKELKIPVVLLSQLNRSLESRADKRPTMADLRESGNIEQDADLIVFLYRDDYYAEREGRSSRAPGLLEFIVAKQREGEVGSAYAKTDLAYCRLDDIDDEELKIALAKGVSLAEGDASSGGGRKSGMGRSARQSSAGAGARGAVPA
ncbi:replicative DNA helicase [Lysobacter fragariae]